MNCDHYKDKTLLGNVDGIVLSRTVATFLPFVKITVLSELKY